MKKTLALVMMLSSTGCWMAGSPDIRCWYVASADTTIGDPWFILVGRTDKFRGDVNGPVFNNVKSLNEYVADHNLQMCGTK